MDYKQQQDVYHQQQDAYHQQQDVYRQRQDTVNMQGQYSNAPVYTENQYQQQPLQQPLQQPRQQDPIRPISQIQPDAPPRALTQVQVNIVTPHSGASMAYVPRLTSPDEFHNSLFGCFKDFFTCKNMSTCEYKPPIQK